MARAGPIAWAGPVVCAEPACATRVPRPACVARSTRVAPPTLVAPTGDDIHHLDRDRVGLPAGQVGGVSDVGEHLVRSPRDLGSNREADHPLAFPCPSGRLA